MRHFQSSMHQLQSPNCPTNLPFDFQSATQERLLERDAEMRILATSAKRTLNCTRRQSRRPGVKRAKLNIGQLVALINNPINEN